MRRSTGWRKNRDYRDVMLLGGTGRTNADRELPIRDVSRAVWSATGTRALRCDVELLEGEQNDLAAYGYNRDGKRGKKQIVVGLLTAADGEPLAVRVFEGNTADPSTLAAQITLLKEQFNVQDVVVVGDRGMVKAKGKAALGEENFKYITALTNAQVRTLLKACILPPDVRYRYYRGRVRGQAPHRPA